MPPRRSNRCARLREQVTANLRQLEGPNAALEHIDFFVEPVRARRAELGRVAASCRRAFTAPTSTPSRKLASNSAAEQRRLLLFRDKWINKPLPYEQVRPLLNGIVNATREQLDAFRGLSEVAAALEAELREREEKEGKGFDRRALFNRLFKPPDSR